MRNGSVRWTRVSAWAAALTAAAWTFAGTAKQAWASPFDNVRIEYWAGDANADNQALLVTDFGDQSYAFGYRWDAQPGGNPPVADQTSLWNMLDAIDQAGDLAIDSTDWGGDLGISINAISYDGQQVNSDWINNFLSIWDSTDGQTWTSTWLGVSSLHLANGGWYGLSNEVVTSESDPVNAPDTPFVPEPATAVLTLLGAAALMTRRRPRHIID